MSASYIVTGHYTGELPGGWHRDFPVHFQLSLSPDADEDLADQAASLLTRIFITKQMKLAMSNLDSRGLLESEDDV